MSELATAHAHGLRWIRTTCTWHISNFPYHIHCMTHFFSLWYCRYDFFLVSQFIQQDTASPLTSMSCLTSRDCMRLGPHAAVNLHAVYATSTITDQWVQEIFRNYLVSENLIPRSPLYVFTITVKNGEDSIHHIRWMWSGRRGERCNCQKKCTGSSIQALYRSFGL